jgi:membrane-bound metal-dependent hydrolase YbcI (DUF457 family)
MLKRRYLVGWQILVLLLGTTWLLAPYLNHALSYRTSLISQYETTAQSYSWLFRGGDFLAGLLVIVAAIYFLRQQYSRGFAWLLLIIGAGLTLDPLLTTTCRQVADSCQEYYSFGFLLHAIETVITSVALFMIGLYDAHVRKRLVSILFCVFQVLYGILFASQLANQEHFNTVSQYFYEVILMVWIVWFVRDYIKPNNYLTGSTEQALAKNFAAAWAFINGVAAIVISLAHINLLGRIKGLYFAGDSAWLAQHGVIVGIIMLYLSRHLARGERRARQIFLAIVGLQILKYSLISPNPDLMMLYGLTFTGLFVLRDDFQIGTVPLTRRMRIKDLYVMLLGLGAALVAALVSLDRDNRVARIGARAIDNFVDYAVGSDNHPISHIRSILLAQTLTAFIVGASAVILWILFRPHKTPHKAGRSYDRIESTLKQYSTSTEDFFKLWPKDKDYFWDKDKSSFIA